MMSFQKEIMTLTLTLTVLFGYQKEIMTLIFTLNVLISQYLDSVDADWPAQKKIT